MSKHYKFVILAICLWVLHSCNSPKYIKTYLYPKNQFGIEKIIDWYFINYKIPAISAAVISEDRIFFINKGTTSRKSQERVTENNLYQIASLSKTFTGIITKSLVNSNHIDLETPILKYFQSELDENNSSKIKNIKISDLLHHTSGFPHTAENLKRKPLGGPVTKEYSLKDMIEDIEDSSLLFEPGSAWSYSNLGYAILGYILEQESKKSYEELIFEHVCKPYNLSSTSTSLNTDQKAALTTPYHPEIGVKTSASKFGLHTSASGVFSNTLDLSKLIVQMLKTTSSKSNPLSVNIPMVGKGELGYGCGAFIKKIPQGKDSILHISHGGDFDGYVSHAGFIPDTKRGLVILSSKGGPWFGEMEGHILKMLTDNSFNF